MLRRPFHSLLRRDSTPADIDLQFEAPDGTHFDFQVKSSGTLGVHENTIDRRILESVAHAADQLPDPAPGPSFIVVGAQRGWPLSGDIDVLEELIGPTAQYPDGRLLLHEDEFGELFRWDHVAGLIALDYRRGFSDFDYGCTVLLNPWAYQHGCEAWFPHSRVLEHRDGVFHWHRGHPDTSTFRGARIAPSRCR